MTRITAIALLAIANFAMAGTSFAQSNEVRSKVPFAFTIGDTSLPAGTYRISMQSDHMIMIRNQGHPSASAFSVVDHLSKKSQNGGELVFQKYGRQYFLSKILCNSAQMNLAIPASKGEKRAQLQQARLNQSSSTTLVAAR
jgi:hypothetical protein